jgi:hypothetical protein
MDPLADYIAALIVIVAVGAFFLFLKHLAERRPD